MSTPVITIPIGPTEELRVTRDDRRGHPVFCQRVWFLKHGRWFPSREGVELPARAAGPLAEALRREGGQ